MDATTVRLILIVLGAILILALYLWERSRGPDEEGSDDGDDEDDTHEAAGPGGREPQGRHARDHVDDPDPEDEGDRPQAPAARADAAPDEGVPAPLLLQLSVAKRYGEFPGLDLLEVAESCGLRPGDMDIFHCLDEFDDGTRVYFSMANMVKPGTFPFDDMEGFNTPGMMLFAQLDGRPEDLTILEEMIATARKLATTLGGDVLDETRRPLTVRKEEELRKSVLANEARFARAARR
ncbi:cell division protein ZipA C-terminal FtsZ-binding domain-containing protein [Candidatus Thiodictyon syntrophicum]|jgi:cell division protein ZipA|uniref:Cell division protein ZipA n=1 Tax=Candidatus Thiodictyon syntrophicum TaxID=1166950 RepID=A0A2K8UDM3_9GAMM|nr:cell division protein ZipA C-terminal FtsZ-binding domain-containing protein [Candidatus Thiodictyon syntrophicum]AUB83577.1 cell division protein ZipA [Candidatus Thiodictyon syntrophicum]